MNPSTEKAIVQFFESIQAALTRIADAQDAILALYTPAQVEVQQVNFDSLPEEVQAGFREKAGLGHEALIESIQEDIQTDAEIEAAEEQTETEFANLDELDQTYSEDEAEEE